MVEDSLKQLRVQDKLKKNFQQKSKVSYSCLAYIYLQIRRNIRSAGPPKHEVMEKIIEKIKQQRLAQNQNDNSLEEVYEAEKKAQTLYESIREGKSLHISSIQQKSLLKRRKKHINFKVIPDLKVSPSEELLKKHAKKPPRAKVNHNITELKALSYHRGLTYTVQISEVKKYIAEIKEKNKIEQEEEETEPNVRFDQALGEELDNDMVNFEARKENPSDISVKLLEEIRESILHEQENHSDNGLN